MVPGRAGAPEVDVRPAGSRFHTSIDWLDSWHSFSFGRHYDPLNTGHGLLLVHNEDTVRAGAGFTAHSHRDMEIVTWVLDGELEHRDSTGTAGVIYAGLAQRMSAGTGITHSEMNASRAEPVHFVQMWVLPDTQGIAPGYEQRDVGTGLAGGGLVPVASGQGHDGAVSIRQRAAVLWAARLRDAASVDLPDAPHVHCFVARGGGELDAIGPLEAGDAVRLTEAGARRFRAHGEVELLVWETN
jgi:redox-sensitive bicupin YhaK (pirin superfamily)